MKSLPELVSKTTSPAAEVAKEPKKYYVAGTIKVELEVTVEAHSYQEAQKDFMTHAVDHLRDFNSLEVRKVKVIGVNEADY